MNNHQPYLQVCNLHKNFGDKTAVDDVSFSARRGEILGYLGPNGAGKSTTLKMISGLLPPDSGSIKVGGIDLRESALEAKRRLGYVPESGALYEKLTPLEYLEMVGQLHHLSAKSIQQKSHEFLACFELTEMANVRMTSFSKGMKQKVVLAAALLHNPDLLLLDEPLNGMDANSVLLFKSLMEYLAGLGKTIIYSSHILEVVEKISHRVLILNQGKMVAQGTIEELRGSNQSSSLEQIFRELTRSEDIVSKVERFAQSILFS